MNTHVASIFLFTIVKELKSTLEKPVILMTQKDYAEGIFNSLVAMRSALLQQAEPARVLDIVSAFHGEWLTAVTDVDTFRKQLRQTPRDLVLRAISFTRVCVKKRLQQFQKYVTELKSTLTEQEKCFIQTDLLTMADMGTAVLAILEEKEKTLRNTADPEEYYNKILDEVEELMNWLDSLNDSLAIEFSKVIGLKIPRLTSDLTKTFRQVAEEVECDSALIEEMQRKGQRIHNLYSEVNELEIKDIITKSKILESRIAKLKQEKSLAVTALENKAHYLQEQLQTLEDLKALTLKNKENIIGASNKTFHIFNHLLPARQRTHLVDELMMLWTEAIYGVNESTKSIISILSATNMQEVFHDELGEYSVDKYGRKIYIIDDCLYQVNDKNKLTAVSDDDKHVYFFDNCGRYYVNNQDDHIYVSYGNDSEYRIDSDHLLHKVSEMRDGIKYCYDNSGKYYLDKNNKRIYYDDETGKKYENDEFGNLVLIRGKFQNGFEHEPLETVEKPMTLTNENVYLKEAVGEALKKCISNVVINQPADPISYLAECLVAYRRSEQVRQHRMEEEKAMMVERELRGRKADSCAYSDCGTEDEGESQLID